jgi:ATP-dependent RNA helicase DeaD
MELPSHQAVKDVRVRRLFDGISRSVADEDLAEMVELLQRYQREHGVDPLLMAAALARHTAAGAAVSVKPRHAQRVPAARLAPPAPATSKTPPAHAATHAPAPKKKRRDKVQDYEVELFRVDVGTTHGAGPGNIVGAIINEAGVDRRYVGKVDMDAEHSTVELPVGMPREIFAHLKKVRVAGRPLNIARV